MVLWGKTLVLALLLIWVYVPFKESNILDLLLNKNKYDLNITPFWNKALIKQVCKALFIVKLH